MSVISGLVCVFVVDFDSRNHEDVAILRRRSSLVPAGQ